MKYYKVPENFRNLKMNVKFEEFLEFSKKITMKNYKTYSKGWCLYC